MKNNNVFLFFFVLIIFLFQLSYPQTYYGLNPDTVKAQKFDMGKMWTFENPPIDYFEKEYGFKPSKELLEKFQKSALKFGGGCSASFISENGLIMTNHHCVRDILKSVQKENENILRDGFIAVSLNDERAVPKLKVEQLLIIKDVTDQVQSSMDKGETDEEKVELRDSEINKIKSQASEQNPELTFKVISLYNGGKYSLYGYKVYNDIRLVFVPELFVAKLGGNPDNFTFPRYGLDCAFLRAYENGKPIKTDFYFKWNSEDIVENQPVFVIGNPGRTNRIYTMAQIEFARDIQYPMLVNMLKEMNSVYEKKVDEDNAQDFNLIARLYGIGNALKVYDGTYKALLDPYLVARKMDFEKHFREEVQGDKKLNENYGSIWSEIEKLRKEMGKNFRKVFAYSIGGFVSPQYLTMANKLVQYAKNLKDDKITQEEFDSLSAKLFPQDFDKELENTLMVIKLNIVKNNLPDNDKMVSKLIGDKSTKQAADEMIRNSVFTSSEKLLKLVRKGADAVLNSDDPFIFFILNTQDELAQILDENKSRIDKEEILNQMLGEALYKVYGDAIPPDATGTLRLADGIVKGYNYNGTEAPIKTTFYGSLDRYYSFNKKFPFNLPAYWENLPKEFDPSASLNFVSTNDIVGGNSGSPVVNVKGEIVGLAFDGNIESLPSNFIYTTEANRTVSVSAVGMIEAIRDLYKINSLANEILNGKINQEEK